MSSWLDVQLIVTDEGEFNLRLLRFKCTGLCLLHHDAGVLAQMCSSNTSNVLLPLSLNPRTPFSIDGLLPGDFPEKKLNVSQDLALRNAISGFKHL